MSWTDERVEVLKTLWTDGLSASQIASQLGGVSRNAVIGKVHRLGLSGRAKVPVAPVAPAGRRPAAEEPEAAPRVAPTPVAQPVAAAQPVTASEPAPGGGRNPRPLRLRLDQLSERTCKWPLGDPVQPDFAFCGHPSDEGRPYCAFHAQMAYQPVADRRRDRTPGIIVAS